jgi:hypothetical protein
VADGWLSLFPTTLSVCAHTTTTTYNNHCVRTKITVYCSVLQLGYECGESAQSHSAAAWGHFHATKMSVTQSNLSTLLMTVVKVE